jgi:hypothetical protein
MEPTIVDFVENAFGASVADVGTLLRTHPDEALRRQEEITGLFHDTWRGPTLEENRATEKGELWPRLPDMVTDVLAIADMRVNESLRYGRAGAGSEAVARELQALLLYAHGLHVPSPLARRRGEPITSREFLHAIAQVCSLAPLIRGGVVRVYEPSVPPASPAADVAEALEELKRHIGLALMSFEALDDMDQGRLYEAGAALVDRAARVVLEDESGGAQGTILFPTQYDRAALAALARTLANPNAPTEPSSTDELLRLELLQTLELPGLESLPLTEMVSIRSDDSFGVFRTDITSALRDVDADVRDGRLEAARRVMAEHMDAGVARLNGKTRRGILREVTLRNSVGWGIGAAIAGSVAGLQGLIGTLLGGLAVGYATEGPSAGRRALRRHYVELGTAGLSKRVKPVDFATFTTDELWGHHRGRGRRVERRDDIVEGLLEEFGD